MSEEKWQKFESNIWLSRRDLFEHHTHVFDDVKYFCDALPSDKTHFRFRQRNNRATRRQEKQATNQVWRCTSSLSLCPSPPPITTPPTIKLPHYSVTPTCNSVGLGTQAVLSGLRAGRGGLSVVAADELVEETWESCIHLPLQQYAASATGQCQNLATSIPFQPSHTRFLYWIAANNFVAQQYGFKLIYLIL